MGISRQEQERAAVIACGKGTSRPKEYANRKRVSTQREGNVLRVDNIASGICIQLQSQSRSYE